jgi:hypothetical protein
MDSIERKLPAADVLIEHGPNDITMAVAGYPVSKVQRAVAEVLNVPAHAVAFVNGHRVNSKRLLRAGDSLVFLLESGRKGVLSPEELEKLGLPREVTAAEAAQILDCDRKTVVRYIRDGVLEWRDVAPPSSCHPEYRIKLDSVVALRTSYRVTPFNRSAVRAQLRRSSSSLPVAPKHISLD